MIPAMKIRSLLIFLITTIAISSCSNFSEEVQEDFIPIPAEKVYGKYYRGDGLGVNHYLELVMNGRFIFRWDGCLGEYDKNEGAFKIEGDKLILSPELPNIQKGFQGTPTQFIIRQAGEDIFLIEKGDLRKFEKDLMGNVSSHGIYYRKIILDVQEDNRYEVGIDSSLRIYDRERTKLLATYTSKDLFGELDKSSPFSRRHALRKYNELDDWPLFFISNNDAKLNVITRRNNRASINLADGKIIRSISEFDTEAITPALKSLDSPIPRRKKTGLIVLGYLKVAESIPAIIKMLDDESYQHTITSGEYKYEPKTIRIAAIRVLAKIQGDKASDLLLKYSKDDDPHTRAAVVCSFVDMKQTVNEGLLLEFIKDNDPYVRLSAVETIGRIGDKKYRGLLEVLKDDKEGYICDWAKSILDLWDGKRTSVAILSGDNYPQDDD